jgi:hypothetical protein
MAVLDLPAVFVVLVIVVTVVAIVALILWDRRRR